MIHKKIYFVFSIIITSNSCKMECSRTNETITKNEYCDIFPNQVSMEKVSLIETMEENKSLQT
jgi:hypothetical protein